ncbi:complement C1q and tumor necrosis factor-related protein 9-like [Pecten maximus]|uniref:complement C1q and tumor necrosis factor-related protein 9-like n=1 Tax=Pecten maximus TaxID=6579 RepID=UPI00145866F1|nr:complement C1q and tumor necrosis factor-related protein 9-like [Pecten maximus]
MLLKCVSLVACLSIAQGQLTDQALKGLDPSLRSILSEIIRRIDDLEQQHNADRQVISKLVRRVRDLETSHIKGLRQVAEITGNSDKVTKGNQHLNHYVDKLPVSLSGPNKSTSDDYFKIQIPTGNENGPSGLWLGKNDAKPKTRVALRDSPTAAPITAVAFYAVLGHEIPETSQNSVILFENSVTNVCGHYSQFTGTFVVIQAGVYVFHWTVKTDFNSWIISELVRNGSVLGTNLSEYPNPGSAIAIASLESGDRVWVRIGSKKAAAEIQPIFTTFSGFLLRAT